MSDKICFSYLPDAPLGIRYRSGNRDVAPQAMRDLPPVPGGGGPMGPCFSYSDGVLPRGLQKAPSGQPSPCFSYQE
jgi:hypothetical protein